MMDVDTTKNIPNPRPVVTLSYAQTLDGRLATSTGSSRWISAPESLHFRHELRATHEAIMVGVDLVLESRIDFGTVNIVHHFLYTDPSRATSSGMTIGKRCPIFSRFVRRYARFEGFGEIRSGMRPTTSTP